MTKKFIFTDLDSTLIPPRKPIPDSAKKAIELLLKNGHEVFACTGRNYFAGEAVLDVAHTGGIYSVGGQIVIDGKTVKLSAFNEENIQTIKDIANKYDFCVSMVTENDVFVNGWAYENRRAEPYYEGHFFPLDQYDGSPCAKMNFHTLPEQEEDLNKAIGELEAHGFSHAFKSIKTSVEITANGISKGSAIRWLADNGYISLQDTIGFGDSYNDLEMLKECAYSIAIGSGDPYIFDFVDMVSDGILDDGFYNAFKKLGLID